MTLMQVVLPEPFGPTRPSTSPSRKAKLTPSSALKPSKRFISLSTLSKGGRTLDAAGLGHTDASTAQERREPVRQEQHQRHDQRAVDQLKILRHVDADHVVNAI